MLSGKHILLIIGGGIAAYKSLDLIRRLRERGAKVTPVLTHAGEEFVTPLSVSALTGVKVFRDLFDLGDEAEMGHIQLSREADLVVVCPATADLLAKMAAGIADDLATTLILATDKPVLTVPAMNVRMWEHSATQRNADWLRQAGVAVMDPDEGPMACGEFGAGRMPEPPSILSRIAQELDLDLDLPELAAPAPAQLAAPLAGDMSPDEGPLSEDWAVEPEMDEEAEDEAPSNGGLGGLLSMIIPRTTETRTHDEIEAELEALPEAEEEAATEEPLDLPAPDPAAGPILATKGKAAAAPPTDPSALAYDHGAGLQSVQTQSVTFENSPLAGQGAFDPDPEHRPLYGKHVLITAGPTREPIDPVRYIANRSSGKQGFAIAAMAAAAGARVTLIAGPVHLPTPVGVDRIDVETAEDMAEEVRRALPVDIAFMVAAVADWKSRHVAGEKMKKRGSAPPALILAENPDILASTAAGRKRPTLLIGFAAETENVVENAKSKRKRKGADWIVANNVAGDVGESVMGGDLNQVHIVTAGGVESLPEMAKEDVARELVLRAAEALAPVEESDD